jgi:hypothetical protein
MTPADRAERQAYLAESHALKKSLIFQKIEFGIFFCLRKSVIGVFGSFETHNNCRDLE